MASLFPQLAISSGCTSSAAVTSSALWVAEKMRKSFECTNEFTKAEELKASPGDLIEFRRDFYDHWGIYIGGGYIIDLINLGNGKGVVRREILSEVAQDGLCRVNNLVKEGRRRGLTARKDNEILKAAFQMLDKEVEYDVLNYNCEHFATECFYGSAFSVQADLLRGNPVANAGAQLFCSGSSNSIQNN